ncbi:MAG TPA: glycine zipper 2TM domain-containing protein [Burkholderiales bacterium]|nr:glycine zipper 2TM domain-containing protein [Burkholderiales bacterium]
MADTSLKTHPLIVIAATAVILTCLLAIGIMTGIVPSPIGRDRGIVQGDSTAVQGRSASVEARIASQERSTSATADAPQAAPRPRLSKREAGTPTGATASRSPSQSVAGSEPASSAAPAAPKVAAVCTNCGRITSVRAVTQQGEAGLLGPAAGGAVGGLIGNQIGSGSGNTIATIAGAALGAGVGTEVERRAKSTTHYVVGVRLENGTTRSFTYRSAPGFQQGDRVRIVDGRLVRDS